MHVLLPVVIFGWLYFKFPRVMLSLTGAAVLLFVVAIAVNESKQNKAAANLPDYPQSYYDRRELAEMKRNDDWCFWDDTKSKYPDPADPRCKYYFEQLAKRGERPDYKVLQPPVVEKKQPVRRVY